MRFNVIFVVGTSGSLRQQWLVEVRYREVALALLRRDIQVARGIYFGSLVREMGQLMLTKPLPMPLPTLGHRHNLTMGLQLAHAVAGPAPALVVVLHDLLGVGNDVPATLSEATNNIIHLFAVNDNAEGAYDGELATQLNTHARAVVLTPAAHGRHAALDIILDRLAERWGTAA